ncbi:MAG: regulatory protein RecX, partial [Spirochaetales bacterium]|nr:regulatory protein RecX [Candidatus Physcosoma equi]
MAQTAYDKALYLLSSREHTEKELKEKLSLKGYGQEDIEGAAVRLKRENYLSEERFAEVYIRSRLRKSPEGKSILSLRLQEKGTPRGVAQAALQEAWERGDYLEPLKEAYSSYER